MLRGYKSDRAARDEWVASRWKQHGLDTVIERRRQQGETNLPVTLGYIRPR